MQGPPRPSEEGLQTNKSPCEPSNHEGGIRALPSLSFLSPFAQSSGKRRPEISHIPGPGVCALAWKAQERSHGGGISGIGFSCCIGMNLPEIQPHGGPASSDSKGGVYTEPVTALSSMPTAGTPVSCLQMFTTPHPLLSGAQGLTGEWRPNQTGNGWPRVSPISHSVRIQKPDQRLETSGLYCKIIQTTHSSSSFSTSPSTRAPYCKVYCIK